MNPQCLDMGVGTLPWSPLARGMLAGNRTRSGEKLTTRASSDAFSDTLYTNPSDWDVIDALNAVAAARGISPATVALAWLMRKPAVTAPIIGASKMAHLEDALRSVDLKLEPEEVAALEAAYVPHAISGHV